MIEKGQKYIWVANVCTENGGRPASHTEKGGFNVKNSREPREVNAVQATWKSLGVAGTKFERSLHRKSSAKRPQ